MNAHLVAEQAVVEHQALQHVKDALRVALSWPSSQENVARKLSSVRFMAQSLERHMHRMMALEEDGGYMEEVLQQQPALKSRIEPLEHEHQQFRADLDSVMRSLAAATAGDTRALDASCSSLQSLLARVDVHDRTECELLQAVLMQDEGGEG